MSRTNGEDVVDLITAIDRRVQRVHTQSLDLSFNELLDMKKDGELDITPDYQRLFRWSEGARSRFIESLLLEMPVPPIYVVEEEDGKYLLIDGLQRISSYLHLRGQLEAPHLDPPIRVGDILTLTDCDIVEELNGRRFEDLGTALQIRLKRAFVRVEVVRKGSDAKFKYHMFKRLNTGGELLSAQQIRNCTIRLLDATFNDFIIRLSRTDEFMRCTSTLTHEKRLEAFDQELVLRFFALKNNRAEFRHDVEDFLTDYMESVSDPDVRRPFNYNEENEVFLKTFQALDRSVADYAFAYFNPVRGSLTRGFSVLHYEAFTLGIQSSLLRINVDDVAQMRRLGELITGIKQDPQFVRISTGGGKNSPGPLRERIEFVQTTLEAAL